MSLEETEAPSPAKRTESSGSPPSQRPFIACRIMKSTGSLHDQPGGVTKPMVLKAWCRWAQERAHAAPGQGKGQGAGACAYPVEGRWSCHRPGHLSLEYILMQETFLYLVLDFSGSPSFQGPSIQVLLPKVPGQISPGERTGQRYGHPCPIVPFFFIGDQFFCSPGGREIALHSYPFPVFREDCPFLPL